MDTATDIFFHIVGHLLCFVEVGLEDIMGLPVALLDRVVAHKLGSDRIKFYLFALGHVDAHVRMTTSLCLAWNVRI